MESSDIASTRLHSQQIVKSKFKSPKELVSWMGAVQAQDYAMVRWALGLRLQDGNLDHINKALDKGEIIRTHVMRPTWHLISSDDIYWMLNLTAPQIRSTMRSSNKALGLTDEVMLSCKKTIAKTIEKRGHTPREELVKELEAIGIDRSDNRHAHVLMLAELDGLICSGISVGNKQTYTLLEERVPQKKLLQHDEALAELANRYFKSHCPATLKDFVWWSGLYVKEAKKAIELISDNLIIEDVSEQTYYIHTSFNDKESIDGKVHILPSFDEFVISYKDRSASITSVHHKKVISQNGIFWPIIVREGKIIGSWKRIIKNQQIRIETNLFRSASNELYQSLEHKLHEYGQFMSKSISVEHKGIK